MPCYTYQQFLDAGRRGEAFQPKQARENARELRGFFSSAFHLLGKRPLYFLCR